MKLGDKVWLSINGRVILNMVIAIHYDFNRDVISVDFKQLAA